MTLQLFNVYATKVADFDGWGIVHFSCTGDVYIGDSKEELEALIPTGSSALQQGILCEAGGPYSFWIRGQLWAIAGGTPVDPQQPSQVRMMVMTDTSGSPIPAGV